MHELHFLTDEQKIKRLDTALDRAIDILVDEYQSSCPLVKGLDCQHPSKAKDCDIEEMGYECWRTYLTRWSE